MNQSDETRFFNSRDFFHRRTIHVPESDLRWMSSMKQSRSFDMTVESFMSALVGYRVLKIESKCLRRFDLFDRTTNLNFGMSRSAD
jgi:hypothetical protein